VAPDTFEAIVSDTHKEHIVKRFGREAGFISDDMDRTLWHIRT
jgi:hypothetical protein